METELKRVGTCLRLRHKGGRLFILPIFHRFPVGILRDILWLFDQLCGVHGFHWDYVKGIQVLQ